MKVLVTEGAGFISSHLREVLLQRGYQVRLLDNSSSGKREYSAGLAVDVRDWDVVHQAALIGVRRSFTRPQLNKCVIEQRPICIVTQ
jgi:nucleoside-diphosphate-sugar epimerase